MVLGREVGRAEADGVLAYWHLVELALVVVVVPVVASDESWFLSAYPYVSSFVANVERVWVVKVCGSLAARIHYMLMSLRVCGMTTCPGSMFRDG